MAKYDLGELIKRFDTRDEQPGAGATTGALSSLIGESLLLDLLIDALREDRSAVKLLDGVPRRDDHAFKDYGLQVPSQRELDAWLVIDDCLVAVECKCWTSSSNNFTSVGDDVAAYAKERWALLHSEDLNADRWTDASKIALPLRVPSRWDAVSRRILAIWTPTSRTGLNAFSSTVTTTPINGTYQDLDIEVFSGSLHARRIQDEGRELYANHDPLLARIAAFEAAITRVIEESDTAE
jgi:hypothetical protein